MTDPQRPPVPTFVTTTWAKLTKDISMTALFITQVCLVYIVVIASLYNLTKAPDSSDGKLWTALLSSCLGILLPNPSVSGGTKKPDKTKHVPNTTQQ